MPRVLFLLSAFVAASACGQSTVANEPQNQSGSEAQLPQTLRGTWSAYSKSIQEYGDLTLGAEVLSWGTCTNTTYRVLQVIEQTYYLELVSPPCRFQRPVAYLILAPSDRSLRVSICSGREELERPADQRHCSLGTLYKKPD